MQSDELRLDDRFGGAAVRVLELLVPVGARVRAEQSLMTVMPIEGGEGAACAFDVVAPYSGRLSDCWVAVDDVVTVGEAILKIIPLDQNQAQDTPAAAPFVYLASQSPRRAQLLAQMGVAHRVFVPTHTDDLAQLELLEVQLEGEQPRDYVCRVTRLKAHAARQRLLGQAQQGFPLAPILCADTTVALGSVILGKPEDAHDAARMLRALSGQEHCVMTAVHLVLPDGETVEALSDSRVRIAHLSESQITAYVASGEPMGKAGAYAIQGRAAAFIEHLSGSYTGVMGLPLYETLQLLVRAGLNPAAEENF